MAAASFSLAGGPRSLSLSLSLSAGARCPEGASRPHRRVSPGLGSGTAPPPSAGEEEEVAEVADDSIRPRGCWHTGRGAPPYGGRKSRAPWPSELKPCWGIRGRAPMGPALKCLEREAAPMGPQAVGPNGPRLSEDRECPNGPAEGLKCESIRKTKIVTSRRTPLSARTVA